MQAVGGEKRFYDFLATNSSPPPLVSLSLSVSAHSLTHRLAPIQQAGPGIQVGLALQGRRLGVQLPHQLEGAPQFGRQLGDRLDKGL
jgi:hypothetical protein